MLPGQRTPQAVQRVRAVVLITLAVPGERADLEGKNLLLVELTRLRWRRAVVVLLVACLLVPVAIWLGAAWNTRPFSDADVAEAERLAQKPWLNHRIV